MLKEIKRVEAVVVYDIALRSWKGKVLKGNLVALGVNFNKSKGALVIEANEENVAEIEKYVGQMNFKYVVDVAIEYVEVEEEEVVIEEVEDLKEIDGFVVYGGSMVRVDRSWIDKVKALVKENNRLIQGDEILLRVKDDVHLLDGRLSIVYKDSYNSQRVWNELDGSLSLRAYLKVKELLE